MEWRALVSHKFLATTHTALTVLKVTPQNTKHEFIFLSFMTDFPLRLGTYRYIYIEYLPSTSLLIPGQLQGCLRAGTLLDYVYIRFG